ncbi:MAG: MFS transporter [Thaumarchaeota archaeon]|nr:MFS transporter [Nitrososphaerota archaeon]
MTKDRDKAGPRANQVLGATTLALLGSSMAVVAYTPVLPLVMAALNLSFTEAGLLNTVQFLTYVTLQVPIGYLVDRYGPRKIISLGVVGVGLFSILFSLSNNLPEALLSRALLGVAFSGVFVPGLRVIGNWYPPKQRGLGIGIFSAGGGLGIGFAGFLVPLLTVFIDWRSSIILISAISIVLGLIAYLLISNPPSAPKLTVGFLSAKIGLRRLIFRRDAMVLGWNHFARLGITSILWIWLPTYLFTSKGFSLPEAGIALGIAGLVALPSNILGGYISDRIKSRISLVVVSWVVLVIIFPALVWSTNMILTFAIIFIASWFANFQRSSLYAIIPELFGSKDSGIETGVQNTWATSGVIILPFLLGIMRDYTGSFDIGWIFLSLVSFISLGFSIYLLKLSRESKES